MTIKESIEVLKKERKSVNDNISVNCRAKDHDHTKCEFCREENELTQAFSQAIKWGEAQQEYLEELPKKKDEFAEKIVRENHPEIGITEEEVKIYNGLHDIASKIIARDKLEITELKLERDRILIRENYYKKQIAELQEKIKELQDKLQESEERRLSLEKSCKEMIEEAKKRLEEKCK